MANDKAGDVKFDADEFGLAAAPSKGSAGEPLGSFSEIVVGEASSFVASVEGLKSTVLAGEGVTAGESDGVPVDPSSSAAKPKSWQVASSLKHILIYGQLRQY